MHAQTLTVSLKKLLVMKLAFIKYRIDKIKELINKDQRKNKFSPVSIGFTHFYIKTTSENSHQHRSEQQPMTQHQNGGAMRLPLTIRFLPFPQLF